MRPVPTWTHQSLRSRSLFRVLAPSLFGEGGKKLPKQENNHEVEQAKQIVSKAIEEPSQALERGHSETLRNYLAAIGRFYRYSLRNVMLIASQNPTATHVAGFHMWHKLGRFVKKGEKGILILAPIVRAKIQGASKPKPMNLQPLSASGRRMCSTSARLTVRSFLKSATSMGDPREYRDRLGKFVTDQGILLED